jgi:serine/threonine protein kinase
MQAVTAIQDKLKLKSMLRATTTGIVVRQLWLLVILCSCWLFLFPCTISQSQAVHACCHCHSSMSAAEICEDKPYNSMSDVWGLGCILYEMTTLKRAFEGNSLPALVAKILRGRFSPIPSRYSVHLRSLIHSMLARNPNRRPSVATILKLPWMHRYSCNRPMPCLHACTLRSCWGDFRIYAICAPPMRWHAVLCACSRCA